MTYNYQEWIKNGKPKIFCKCECNEEIIIKNIHKYNNIPEYINGHQSWGKNNGMFGKIHTEKTKQKMKESKSQNPAWNKGLNSFDDLRILSGEKHPFYDKQHNEKTKNKISLKAKERLSNKENHPMYGKHQSNESNQKNRESNKNHIPWNKDKTTNDDNRIPSGNKASNWKGGLHFLPYCEKFNESLKKSIRKRDNYICQMPECLCTQLESLILYKQSLHVHHIHYDKPNCNPDLITLCNKHNSVVNFNRDYWEELFMNMLKKINKLEE